MKRLLDSESGGPLVERARRLLRAAQPEHPALSPAVQFGQPIRPSPRYAASPWVRLMRWFQRAQTGTGRRLKPALVVGSITVAAGAAAHIGVKAWHETSVHTTGTRQTAAEPVRTSSVHQRRNTARSRAAPADSESPERVVETEIAEPVQLHRTAPPPTAPTPRAESAPPMRAQTPQPPPRSSELEKSPSSDAKPPAQLHAELVHSAMLALRRDGDPGRAAKLLERYEGRDSRGPLAEEALALRIEAALAERDDSAPRYARDYLARYPTGRYRGVALRALRGTEHP